jgi:hypothetical protein
MYAGMSAVGVAAAFAADLWLEHPRQTRSLAAGAALLVGLFLHGSALVMAAGLLLVPGRRTDRQAWWWRGSVLGALGLWVMAWGPSFLDQLKASTSSWIPHTTPSYFAATLNELVTSYAVTRWVVLALVVAGCVLLARRDRRMARLLMCCFVVPVALSAVIGVRAHFLLPRTLAFLSWAPLLALAAVVEHALRRARVVGLAAAVGVGVLLVPSTVATLSGQEPASAAVLARVERVARPGDAVAVHPTWLRPLTHWYISARRPGPARSMCIEGLSADTLVLGAAPWSGRVWLVEPVTYETPQTRLRSCGKTWQQSGYRLVCLQVGP